MNREMRRHPKHPALPFVERCGTVKDTVARIKPDTASKQNRIKKRHK